MLEIYPQIIVISPPQFIKEQYMNNLKSRFINQAFLPLFYIVMNTAVHAATGDISTVYFSGKPIDAAFDNLGNMYVADFATYRIAKVTPSGSTSSFAGTGATLGPVGDHGMATEAYINGTNGVYVNSNDVYISSQTRIRKVDSSGIITTVAGTGVSGYIGDSGDATLAQVSNPHGMTSDTSGNIYFADTDNHCIRKISTDGIITTVAGIGKPGFAGDGKFAIKASLHSPTDVALDSSGNLYIADSENSRVRKISINGVISTYYKFAASIWGLAIDDVDNIYVNIGEPGEITQIVKVDPKLNLTELVSNQDGYGGDNGPALTAQVGAVKGLTVDTAGNLYLSDYDNQRIRKIEGVSTSFSNVYRLYNPNNGEHLYTTFKDEYDMLGPIGWVQESVGFRGLSNASRFNSITAKPWLRLYNPNSGLHHWTISESEYDGLGALGWNQEGATGYIFESDTVGLTPLFRLYNPNDGNHHWTMDSAEKDLLVVIGWQAEGVAGYVYPPN